MSIIGFDIGNETCQIAIARAGGIEVIDNEYSLRSTPLYVGFRGKSRDIGLAAKNRLIPNTSNTIFNFKMILGETFSNNTAQKELSYLPYDAYELSNDNVAVKVNYCNKEVMLSMQQIMAIMLTKLKAIAETKTGAKVQDCVISVPIFYTDKQRRALMNSAEIAGLKPLQILNESTAAALIYGYYRQHTFDADAKIVVFVDLGQSALTVTACKFHEDGLSVLGCVWNRNVGGRDFDSVLVKHFVEEFKIKYNIDVSRNTKALMTLLLECENLKKQMSANSRELEINIECLMNDIDVKGKMKRELFENLSSSLLINIEKSMKDLVTKCNLNIKEIDSIQIIGGSSRLPALKNLITKVFGKEPQATLNQDEAVARGCSLQCALLSPTVRTKTFKIDDIQPYAIKIIYKTDNLTEELPVFNYLHKIPSLRVITLQFKGLFKLEAYFENETGDLRKIGHYAFSNIPKEVHTSSEAKVKVKVSIDTNGIFNIVSARMIVISSDNSARNETNMTVVPYDDNISPGKILESENKMEADTNNENDEGVQTTAKSYELPFTSFQSEMSKNDLNSCINQEREMRENDSKAKKIADIKNDLEEYMFYSRDKLFNELIDFVDTSNKNQLVQKIDDTEEWLYDSSDLEEESEFSRHLEELKRQFEPIFNKFKKIKGISQALKEFRTVLENSAEDIKCFCQANENRFSGLCNEIREMWNRANEYVNIYSAKISVTKCCDELIVSAEIIRQEMKFFKEKILEVFESCETKEELLCETSNTLKTVENTEEQKNEIIQDDRKEKVREVPTELK